MKKLMLIVGVLMIAGGISAHGYGEYRGGYGCHERVVVRPYYNPYVVVRTAPVYYDGYREGYRHDCDRDRDRDRCYDRDRDRRYDRDRDYRGDDRDRGYYR
jgi:hypothetical protein